MIFDCAGKTLDLSRPSVMGILNVTPDSFSDGGSYELVERAVERAHQMVEVGASIIDIGGESTRPGAQPVSESEELDRIIPVIEALAPRLTIPISIDTTKPGVMEHAVHAGAGFINDVMALQAPGAIEVVATCGVPACLMHMQGQPRTMQHAPHYLNVIDEVKRFLLQRVEACVAAGIQRDRIMIDPGFGFGKTLAHNLTLLKGLKHFVETGLPVMAGISRKSMIGAILNADIDQRLYGSIATAVMAAEAGASLLRVHDVKPTVDALRIVSAVMSQREV